MNRRTVQVVVGVGALLVSVLLYIRLLVAYPLGADIDDARFILRSQSLRHGAYERLESPGRPRTNLPLPGYPLLLLPVSSSANPLIPQTFSVILTLCMGLAAGALFWAWSPASAVFATSLLMLHPLIVSRSASVLTEIPFTLFVLASFLLFRRARQTDRVSHWLLLGVLLAWTALLRTEGLIVSLAIAAGVAVSEHRRRWTMVLGLPAGLLGVIFWWNLVRTGASSDYFTIASAGLHRSSGQSLGAWAFHFLKAIGQLGTQGLAGQLWPNGNAWTIGFGWSFVAVCIASAVQWFRRRDLLRDPESVGLLFYLVGYVVIHLAWPAPLHRHWIPIIPFVLLFLVDGGWASESPRYRKAAHVGLAIIGLTTVVNANHIVRGQFLVPVLPTDTYAWIVRATTPKDVFLAADGPTLRLWTGRTSHWGVKETDPDDFYNQLLTTNVRYIVDRHLALASPVNEANVLDRHRRWIAEDPDRYKEVFVSSREQSRVLEVVQSSRFVEAYDNFKWASARLGSDEHEAARDRLRHALALYPRFPVAQNVLGVTLMLEGKQLDRAKQLFEQAVAQRPSFSAAWANLARVQRRLGFENEAAHAYERAMETAQASGATTRFRQAIAEERATLRATRSGS